MDNNRKLRAQRGSGSKRAHRKTVLAVFTLFIVALSLIAVFYPIFFSSEIPRVYGASDPTTVSQSSGSPSASAVRDVSVENDVYFDGANYHFITQYGNYSWIQPGNILEYYNLNGTKIIDKSVFVLQENSSGTWLPLINMNPSGVSVTVANSSHYVASYTLEDKYRGKNYDIADVEITMDLVHSLALPKISISMVQDVANWSLCGNGDFRWIWDVVPYVDDITGEGFQYWINSNGTKTFLPSGNNQVIDLGVDYVGSLSDSFSNSSFSLRLDCSDEQLPVKWIGGEEPFWNSRGVVSIFPVNQADIDPSTVYSGGLLEYATGHENQRMVFKNPRGQEYYYVLVRISSASSRIYKSSDGSSWTSECYIHTSYSVSDVAMAIQEDDSNSRLYVHITYVWSTSLRSEAYYIADSGTTWTSLYTVENVDSATDDGLHFISTCIDDDGYIWISFVDEYTSGGKQRFDTYVTVSSSALPTSTSVSWSKVKVYDGSSDTYNSNPSTSEIVPLTTTGDVALVTAVHTYGLAGSKVYQWRIYGYVITRGSPPSAGSQVGILTSNGGKEYHSLYTITSCVVESGSNSDVFVAFSYSTTPYAVQVRKWDISGGSAANFGVFETPSGDIIESLCMSIDTYSDPDVLYVFWTNSTQGYVFYDSSEVDSFSLIGDESIDDTGINEDNYYLSSSYMDWSGDGELQVIWTTGTNYYVRFAKINEGAGDYYKTASLSLDFSFDGDLTYVEVSRSVSLALTFVFSAAALIEVLKTGSLSLTFTFNAVGEFSISRSAALSLAFVFSAVVSYLEVSRAASLVISFVFGSAILLELLKAASLSISTNFSTVRELIASRVASLGVSWSSNVAATFEAVRSAAQSISWSSSVSTLIEAYKTGSLSLSWSSSVALLKEILRSASLSISMGFSTVGEFILSRTASLSLSVSSSASRILEAYKTGSLSITWSSSVAVLKEFLKSASLSITTGFSAAVQVGGEFLRDATLSITTSFNTSKLMEFLKSASLSITTGFSTVAQVGAQYLRDATLTISTSFVGDAWKNVDQVGVATLGISFLFHAFWGEAARRGEYMAALLLASFILIPLILLILWAARRKF